MRIALCWALLGSISLLASVADAGYTRSNEPVPEPKREFRGAWLATVYNINWPSKAGLDATTQKAELISLLDTAAATHLNAVILQVRPACDALYASKIEPWAKYLTGTMGKSPGYDPLEFAVVEAHRRGLELHAWINPFRAVTGSGAVATTHVSKQHPEWMRPYGTQQWIDPGLPGVREYSLRVCGDIVSRYDIDGLHLDDYFYPYPIKNAGVITPFPDDATFAAQGGVGDRAAWRRANIDDFVQRLYRQVKAAKSWVKLGLSPFGIWRPGVPATIEARLDSFQELAGDSKRWFSEGWCDYFSPQLYWRIDPPQQSFSTLLTWWSEQNKSARHLWPGVATSRIQSSEDQGRPASEILRQVELAKSGQVHWNISPLKKDTDGIATKLLQGPYADEALIPASPWLGKSVPPAPIVKLTETKKGPEFSWTAESSTRWWIVQTKDATGWKLRAALPSSTTQFSAKGNPTAISVRGCSATGLLGLAVVFQN